MAGGALPVGRNPVGLDSPACRCATPGVLLAEFASHQTFSAQRFHRQATPPDRYASKAPRPLGMGDGTCVHYIHAPRGAQASGSPGVSLPHGGLLYRLGHQVPVPRLPLDGFARASPHSCGS